MKDAGHRNFERMTMNTPTLKTQRLIQGTMQKHFMKSNSNVSTDDSYDFGYGLHKEFWHKGIVTEAGKAVIEQLKKDGIPYITATHDVNNPRSGGVMKQLGMKYQYSYEEQWQPKDILVTFRMYQLNLDEDINRVYKKYWDHSAVHFVETDI